MTIISVHIDHETEARLRQAASDLGRPVEELCEAAISEMALDFFRYQPSRDPARQAKREVHA